jgi:hypothetical protein
MPALALGQVADADARRLEPGVVHPIVRVEIVAFSTGRGRTKTRDCPYARVATRCAARSDQ